MDLKPGIYLYKGNRIKIISLAQGQVYYLKSSSRSRSGWTDRLFIELLTNFEIGECVHE